MLHWWSTMKPSDIAILTFLILVTLGLIWNGWIGYNLFREDKKVQPTEVYIEEVQEQFGYNYTEAYTYAYYYNLLNAIKLKNRLVISSYAKSWPEQVIDGDVPADRAKEIIKKAQRDFNKLYPSH